MEWISVKDRMPEEHERVLLIKNDEIEFAEVGVLFCSKFYDSYDNEINEPTHWMPLPNPPKDTQERLLEASHTKYIPLKD